MHFIIPRIETLLADHLFAPVSGLSALSRLKAHQLDRPADAEKDAEDTTINLDQTLVIEAGEPTAAEGMPTSTGALSVPVRVTLNAAARPPKSESEIGVTRATFDAWVDLVWPLLVPGVENQLRLRTLAEVTTLAEGPLMIYDSIYVSGDDESADDRFIESVTVNLICGAH